MTLLFYTEVVYTQYNNELLSPVKAKAASPAVLSMVTIFFKQSFPINASQSGASI